MATWSRGRLGRQGLPDGAPVDSGRRARDRRRRPWFWALLALTTLVVTIVAVASALVANPSDDVPDDPDVVVVLGGFGEERTELGIALADESGAALVLSSSAADFGNERGYACGCDAICLEPDPETTIGEAQAVAVLAEQRGWERVAVVTSTHHTTRARVLFRQCLRHVSVVGAPRRDGGPELADYVREVVGTFAALSIRRAC
jgi:uncharacterized SAM-binding protein YcdF (DUF218 family)